MTVPHEVRAHDEHVHSPPPLQKVRNEPLGPDLQHTFGHIDCPACGATNPMEHDPDGLAKLLFPEAARKWLETRKPFLKPRTYYGYEQCIERLSVFFYALPLQGVHIGHLRTYQSQRLINEGHAWPKLAGPSIINHELSIMQSVLKRAKLWKPFKYTYEPLPVPRKRKKKTMTDDEELHLLRVAGGRPSWELAFWVASITENTSASGTELRYLLHEDLHLNDEIPWIRIDDATVKNEYRGRIIALNPAALWYLKKCVIRAKTLGSSEPQHFLFPHRLKPGIWNPCRPAGASWMRRSFAQLRKATGFDWLTPHCLRHQCATLMYENETDEMTIQHTMGHQSAQMSREYSHNRLKKQKKALDMIDPTVRLGVKRVEYDPYTAPKNNYSIGY